MDNIEQIKERLAQIIDYRQFREIGEHNPKIKHIKKLLTNSKPNPSKQFIAEGIWIFKKLVEFDTEVDSVIIAPECIYTHEAVAVLEQVIAKTDDLYVVSEKTFLKISERDKPDGLLCVAKLPMRDIADFRVADRSIVLVLDGVEIPGNIGTMLRMADGAGVDAVLICNKKARLTHPKLIKGSMGAALTVPIFEFSEYGECMDWLKKKGFRIFLADTRAEKSYFEEQYCNKVAFVMGSERYGISREWYTADVSLISIPMVGRCDSLNVGVAATVLAYDAAMKVKLRKN